MKIVLCNITFQYHYAMSCDINQKWTGVLHNIGDSLENETWLLFVGFLSFRRINAGMYWKLGKYIFVHTLDVNVTVGILTYFKYIFCTDLFKSRWHKCLPVLSWLFYFKNNLYIQPENVIEYSCIIIFHCWQR